MLFLEIHTFVLDGVIKMRQRASALVQIQFLCEPYVIYAMKKHSLLCLGVADCPNH